MKTEGLAATGLLRAKPLPTLFIVGICMAIAVAEWVFAYRSAGSGIVLALLITLAIYVVVSVIRMGQALTDCAEFLALIPLYILFTSSLPWFFVEQQFLLPAVYSVILALCFWQIYDKDISLTQMGLRSRNLVKFAIFGTLLGMVAGSSEYFVLRLAPAFPSFEVKYLIRDLIYMLCFVGLGEEILFRGLIQRGLERVFGWRWALLGASFVFMVMHLSWRSIPELGFTFAVGMALGYLYHRTGSLVLPIIIHGMGNTVLVAVMPYIFMSS